MYLSRLNGIFAQQDSNEDGIISEAEFRQLLRTIQSACGIFPSHEEDAEIERLLEIVDPNNNQQITHSQVAYLLMNESVPIQGDYLQRRVPMLQFINDFADENGTFAASTGYNTRRDDDIHHLDEDVIQDNLAKLVDFASEIQPTGAPINMR